MQSYVYLSIYKKGAKEWQADKEVIAADNMDTVGRQGVEIVEKIRENNPAASLIWLSGRDNALESWRLHVTAFGVFPTKKEELEELLAACSESLLNRKKKYFV